MVANDGVRDAGVVRDAGRAVALRYCARPGCPASAEATLRFAYHAREAVIDPLAAEPVPQTYDLCGPHAERTRPPHGWTLRDLRPEAAAPETPGRSAPAQARRPTRGVGAYGDQEMVALLAAALNAAAGVGSTDALGPVGSASA